ncbi:MAG: integration host factor subunit alpha [Alphaproteobacteria bacterium]
MKKNLTRAELAQAVFDDLGLSFSESERLVDSFFEEIVKALEAGNNVKISSFGTFSLKDKKQRIGRNPKTGQEYPIKAHRSVTFTPAVSLKESLYNVRLDEKDE